MVEGAGEVRIPTRLSEAALLIDPQIIGVCQIRAEVGVEGILETK